MTFQAIIRQLHGFWSQQGCVLLQPYDCEAGAGTFHPATFLGALGRRPGRVAYVAPTRRPTDGRYGENPNRLQHYYQYQVLLKPAPATIQDLYLQSLAAIGLDPRDHDLRFVHDDWESPTLGAWGLGWEVRVDGMEVTQFTYFQEVGGVTLDPVSVELTYGLGRLAMMIQGKDNVYDVVWTDGVTYGEIQQEGERQFSRYNFEAADVETLRTLFARYEVEGHRLLDQSLVLPAYDHCIKTSHLFNLLEARGAMSVAERARVMAKVRELARRCARAAAETAALAERAV